MILLGKEITLRFKCHLFSLHKYVHTRSLFDVCIWNTLCECRLFSCLFYRWTREYLKYKFDKCNRATKRGKKLSFFFTSKYRKKSFAYSFERSKCLWSQWRTISWFCQIFCWIKYNSFGWFWWLLVEILNSITCQNQCLFQPTKYNLQLTLNTFLVHLHGQPNENWEKLSVSEWFIHSNIYLVYFFHLFVKRKRSVYFIRSIKTYHITTQKIRQNGLNKHMLCFTRIV